jgi:DNA-binding response OmpR family regulator
MREDNVATLSIEEAGTEVLTAPAAPGAEPASPALVRREKDEANWYCASDIKLLILDDDASVCRIIQSALARNDFTVEAVSDPALMQAWIKKDSYHIIILDYCIPGLECESTLDLVKEHQPEASVIVVTAYPSIDSALSCLRARTYDYLTKPFQVHELQRTVTRCLESKGLLRLSEEALRESLGNVIRERRKALGLTLAQMAKRTNVSLGYLSQIELGKNSASIETLYRISLGLRVRVADLFQAVQMPPT